MRPESAPLAAPSLGGAGVHPRRHIVRRKGPPLSGAHLRDTALCGALWDRAHPLKGEICGECLDLYQSMHPGWPVPE